MIVYLLWSSRCGSTQLEEIFTTKIDAEQCLRKFKEQDGQSGRVYHYWIQEKEVHHGKA